MRPKAALGIRVKGLGFRMQRFADQAFAPEGRRSVATGEVRRRRTQPVDSFAPQPSRPGGAEGASRGKQNAKEHLAVRSAYRALVNATRQSFAPPGRKGSDGPVFHGFRVGPLRSPSAPPVATLHRPSGAKARPVGVSAGSGPGNEWQAGQVVDLPPLDASVRNARRYCHEPGVSWLRGPPRASPHQPAIRLGFERVVRWVR